MYFLQCPATVPPRFGGKRRLPRPDSYTPPLLVTIKGGGRLPLDSLVLSLWGHPHTHKQASGRDPSSLTPRHPNSPRLIPLLAETWELPSLSHLACTPYYQHSGCKIIQCPRTPSCWTYDPAAGTRINSCVTVLPLASTSGTRKCAAFTSWDPDPRGQDTNSWRAR